jgi:hypothetical protein
MMLPTIHMNGTSREDLLRGYCDAIWTLVDAIEALGQTAPNGRDYYPQGPDACTVANQEHESRKRALMRVMSELQALAEHVEERQK